jgi:phosphatidylglycerol:prolipoprotein diacylglycerol transferase
MFIFEQIIQLLSLAYVHDLSPFAIKFSESFGLRWYGLSYLAGFVCAYLILLYLSKKGKISLNKEQVSDFVFYVAVGVIIGGRLGYCVFYDPSLFTKFSNNFPFWGALEVHKGGMASHGGIIGVIASCLLFARKEKLLRLELLDLVALTACLGIFFGRMANFVNGELLGRPAPENYAFAVKFPQELYEIEAKDFYKLSAAAESLGFSKESVDFAIRSNDLAFFSRISEKAIEAVQAGNSQVKLVLEPALTARYPSQIYAALLEGLIIFIGLWLLHIKFSRIGVASAGFVVMYPIMRIISEQFRLPDAQIGFQALGLTRGQWISIGMLVFSLIYLVIFLWQSKAEKK